MVIYRVEISILDNGTQGETFSSRKEALKACFLVLSALDFKKRYSNIAFIESQIKRHSCTKAGITDKGLGFSLDLYKIQ